ncbi:MAG: GntR family transcriptional regulator [Muribaculaceae bacterium]|nr:GntR family transcriptional regulator [Muribaculaceae bacterium]
MAQIRAGRWEVECRIPSTKELAVELAVNNRTVMKAYDDLSDAGVIYQRRGLGYYVAPDAPDKIRELYRREFLTSILPPVRLAMELAGLTPEEVMELLSK